jgi:hypothetical protein
MRPAPRFCLPACLLVLLLAATTASAKTQPVITHLFLVPVTLPDGRDAAPALVDLEAWLAESFGGYTRLGTGQGGWKNEPGQVETQVNAAYLVTAPRDVSREIADRLTRDFGERVPYVLVFPAGMFVR